MDIIFEPKTVKAFRECAHQIKRTQLSMEGVVPDVSDDIGRLCFLQPSVLLKSKDVTARGAAVTGEMTVALLYINELENAVFDLHFTQSFSLEFELPEPDPDMLLQVRLFVSSTEARAINPRKVSVSVEVGGELTGYTEGETPISVEIPPVEDNRIYARKEAVQTAMINAVCEKTFVVNEQFPFSGGRAAPERLVAQDVSFRLAERQLIGSKILLKGTVCVRVCSFSQENDYPVFSDFTAPFSQLVDIGREEMDGCEVQIEPTSVYFNLVDSIGGEKALDAEIHAVAQLVSRCRQTVEYVSDAYAGRCPSTLTFEPRSVSAAEPPERILLEADNKIELPDDCEDVLSVLATLGQCSAAQGKAEASINFDVLYRSAAGTLSYVKRAVSVTADCPDQTVVILDKRLLDNYLRPEGNQLIGRVSVEMWIERRAETEIRCALAMSLDEGSPYDDAALPTVCAVRVDRESIWDLAKRYHSSCEKIEALNEIDGPIRGKMLLIPKSK